MNMTDAVAVLVEGTLASSVAILLVLALRKPLRDRFGAAAGYAAWWLVPAAVLAVLLPAGVAPVEVSTGQLGVGFGAGVGADAPVRAAPAPASRAVSDRTVFVMAERRKI